MPAAAKWLRVHPIQEGEIRDLQHCTAQWRKDAMLQTVQADVDVQQ